MLSVEAADSPDAPSARLGEARKQINLAIEGCGEDTDGSDRREALRLINGILVGADSVSDTH